MKTLIKGLLALIGCAVLPMLDASAQAQCSDGRDNDGDGLVDAYVELPTLNGQVYRLGGVGDPGLVRATVENLVRSRKLNLTPPVNGAGAAMVRSDGGSWSNTGTNQGVGITEHLPTLQMVCRVLGYRDYVSSTCRDGERSGRYPNGKCNYHSPSDNYHWRSNGSNFVGESANPKYGKTWIASITCQNRLPACSDGWDNDGDGAVDLADLGCRNANDDSELVDDPKCTTPSGTTEAEQCRNGLDDDGDGAIDNADPGCWTNPSDSTTFNPNLDDESRATTQCRDDRDNDGDGAVDMADFSCSTPQDNDEANPKSQCQDGVDNDNDGAIDLTDFSCQGNSQANDETNPKSQCQDGVDNDGDGATDLADFSCQGNKQANDEANPKSQCQDGVDNDGDGASDLADFSCQGNNQVNDEGNPKSQCQDGIDNDNDGAIDLADFSCGGNKQANDEGNPKSQCQDGIDNDNDGAIDLADFSCGGNKQANDEANPKSQCQDGVDNDGDGASDLADFSCQGNSQDNDEGNPKSQCQDGIDNDNDGAIDLADFSCGGNKQANDEGNPKSQCQDGVDNDGDGAIDLADFSCGGNSQANDEAYPKSQCQDGIDNDNDGAIDLADFGCGGNNQGNDEGGSKSQCQDGIDNDYDGAIDLADFSCGGNMQHDDETNPKSQCQDLIDNDNDGAIDRADFSCSSNQDNDESDPKSQCQDDFDNDKDGLEDMLDPGCSDAQDNDESDESSALTVGVECVYDNQDGTYTAYFGYNNVSSEELEVPLGYVKPLKNEFSPGDTDRGQVTRFSRGISKGVFGVVFDGQPLTWSVRAKGSSLSQATASVNSPACKRVEPIAECIDGSPEGLKVTFGYRNPNDFPITIPVGSLNFFAPAPQDRGQPTTLKAGLMEGAFSTVFQDRLTWYLDGMAATVTKSTPVCPGGCVETPIGTVKNELNQTAIDLAKLTRKAAKQLGGLASQRVRQGKLAAATASKLTRDAMRAAKKADSLAKRAQSLTLGFPEVIKSCPFSQPFCESVDRGETIELLKGLYADILNQLKRIQARRNFKVTGNTSRVDPLVTEGKRLKEGGDEQLGRLPRVETVCK